MVLDGEGRAARARRAWHFGSGVEMGSKIVVVHPRACLLRILTTEEGRVASQIYGATVRALDLVCRFSGPRALETCVITCEKQMEQYDGMIAPVMNAAATAPGQQRKQVERCDTSTKDGISAGFFQSALPGEKVSDLHGSTPLAPKPRSSAGCGRRRDPDRLRMLLGILIRVSFHEAMDA